jgi:hypothetical protein
VISALREAVAMKTWPRVPLGWIAMLVIAVALAGHLYYG